MWLLVFLVLFLAAFGVIGCKNKSALVPPANTPPTPNNEEKLFTPTMRVIVSHMVIGKGQAHFEGTTELYNATLQTQLYQDEKPLDWWPAHQDIKANGYLWEVTVTLAKELPVESSYVLKIWDKDNPSLYGIFIFDLKGPPSVSAVQ
jgi:hypothetical protein